MNTADTVFDALHDQHLPPPPWRTIGGGVWGRVFDLGDGSVLKLVRHTGGIGSGREIFSGEVRALTLANGMGPKLRTARVLSSGDMPTVAAACADYCGWLRMTHLPGITAARAISDAKDANERATVLRRVGAAAGTFLRQSAGILPGGPTLPALSHQRLLEIADIVPDMRAGCSDVAAALAQGPQHPFLHGDINSGNVLMMPAGSQDADYAGLVDMGEAQCGPVEIELRHARDFGADPGAMLEGFARSYGHAPDPDRLQAAYCLNALGTLAIATLGTVAGLDAATARKTALDDLSRLG